MILLRKPPVVSVNLFEARSGVKTHVDLRELMRRYLARYFKQDRRGVSPPLMQKFASLDRYQPSHL